MRWLWRLAIAAVLIGLAKWGIDARFQQVLSRAADDTSCPQIWAHRGRLEGQPANTLSSALNVVERGVTGLELDIHYDVDQQIFWVIHDDPNGQDKLTRDTLETFLTALAPFSPGLWLDAKNFGGLSPWAASAAANRLADLLATYVPDSRVYVESRNPFYLWMLQQRGVGTSYLVSPNSRHASPIFWLNVYWMKWSFGWGPFDALSMDIGRYDDKVAAAFEGAPLLLSTVNEASHLSTLLALPNVKAMLTDIALFDVADCP